MKLGAKMEETEEWEEDDGVTQQMAKAYHVVVRKNKTWEKLRYFVAPCIRLFAQSFLHPCRVPFKWLRWLVLLLVGAAFLFPGTYAPSCAAPVF